MYLTVGMVSLAGVVKASLPFDPLRAFLSAASVLGFFCAVALFSSLLQLPALAMSGAVLLPLIVIPGILLTILLAIPMRRNALVLEKNKP